MGKRYHFKEFVILILLFAVSSAAARDRLSCIPSSLATVISGTVIDTDTGETLPGVNILVKNKVVGTSTNSNGDFELQVDQDPPLTLIFSSVGYATKEVEVTLNEQTNLLVELKKETLVSADIVVSASRVEENILQSPVSIEKMDIISIQNTASPDFYENISNLKGVQMTASSLTFKSVNTRGFNSIANTRFVQLVDGMDNAPPGLNFPTGNLTGISELDVASVELVPGAASALYGPNAFNGILIINSKDPFLYEGFSAQVKTGLTDAEEPETNPFGEINLRYAKALNDKFAFKINASALRGTDWYATNYDDNDQNPINAGVRGPQSPSYDGLNIYGDEIATTINLDNVAGTPAGTLGRIRVARTGYQERDLTEYDAESYKLSSSLHYRLTDNLEGIYQYRLGKGTTVYQGANRYSLQDITIQQHKLELRGNNFFVRGYTSGEDAGDSYDMRFAAWNINRAWKSDQQWFQEYTGAYLGQVPGVAPMDHNAARAFADRNRYVPGTPEFEEAKKRITNLADLKNGSKFVDTSRLNHVEANYDFSDQIDLFNLQIGGNYRNYHLNSEGTIFNDSDGAININEWGAYTQLSKSLINDRLKLTGSIRYDKNENFDGRFSPRASAVILLDEEGLHNLRGSFQTGFRNPDTQSQFIGLDVGVATLVGGTRQNVDNYSVSAPYIDSDNNQQTTTVAGRDLYNNSYTASSVIAFSGSGNPADLEVSDVDFIKPEQIRTWEIGYRGFIAEKLKLDLNFYYSNYEDFQATTTVIVPLTGSVQDASGIQDLANGRTKVFQLYSNVKESVTSYGFGVAISYNLPGGFLLDGNYTYADFDLEKANPDIIPGFNTPKNSYSISLGNRNLTGNLGFKITNRWSEEFRWEAGFGNGQIDSYNVTDIQLTYSVPSISADIKLGGANVFNESYYQAYGAPTIGAQYYLSVRFDRLFD